VKVIVAQKGAREHFLAARALRAKGQLAGLVVDWYGFGGAAGQLVGLFGKAARSAVGAKSDSLPAEVVHPLRLLGLWSKWTERGAARRGALNEGYDRTDAAFARAVGRLKLPEHCVFFGYSYASLEALEVEKQRGCLTIVDQIDPGPAEYKLVAEEMVRYPELAGAPETFPSGHFDRCRREWELADVIIVNSEWTREAIVAEGADPGKIELLPLAYEVDGGRQTTDHRQRTTDRGSLKVLWLGQVNVRKGIHYLIEAARMLEKEAVEFVIAGALGIRPEVVSTAPRNMKWVGPVPRSQASEFYRQSHVFVLPTLSDGFAITQIEALAHGLPVIVTPNCGRVVEDGATGFIIPPRDAGELAEAIMNLVRNRGLIAEMRPRCIEAAKTFSIDAYARRLLQIIQERYRTFFLRPKSDGSPHQPGLQQRLSY
jgi:glycosyltransferase involved in cell wall biosynthesis